MIDFLLESSEFEWLFNNLINEIIVIWKKKNKEWSRNGPRSSSLGTQFRQRCLYHFPKYRKRFGSGVDRDIERESWNPGAIHSLTPTSLWLFSVEPPHASINCTPINERYPSTRRSQLSTHPHPHTRPHHMLRHRLRPLPHPSAFPRRRSSSSPRSTIWWTGLAVAPSGLWPSDSPAAPSKWCTPAPPAMISIASASFSGPALASLTVWSSQALSPTRWLPLFASNPLSFFLGFLLP